MIRLAVVVVLAACAGGGMAGEPVRGVMVEVEIASVTLDDCVAGDVDRNDGCGEAARLQLSLRSSSSRTIDIRIEAVELLDLGGAKLASLPARQPMRWTDTGTFAAWNQTLGAGEILATTYSLGKPVWSAAGGHYDRSATYRVRVVVSVGGTARKIEKQTKVMPEPAVDT